MRNLAYNICKIFLKSLSGKQFSYLILFYSLSITSNGNAQTRINNWDSLFCERYYNNYGNFISLQKYWLSVSVSKRLTDLTPLGYGLDALQAMFQATDSTVYIDYTITLINNVISRARISSRISGNLYQLKDNYKGWIAEIPHEEGFHTEDPLSESYFFQYVSKLLRDIRTRPAIFKEQKYQSFYFRTLNFIETNVWDKWESRGIKFGDKYVYMLRSRTHMASHWAYIAADLSTLTTSSTRRSDYLNVVNLYNKNLENNFVKYGPYIKWNSTWDISFKGIRDSVNIIQDVAHGNQVVAYIIEANEVHLWNDSTVIKRLVNTLKDKLWDAVNCTFADNVDGTMFDLTYAKIWSGGSFQAPGFVKLTRFDKSLFSIYEKFINCNKYLTASYQYGELYANLFLSTKLLFSEKKTQ